MTLTFYLNVGRKLPQFKLLSDSFRYLVVQLPVRIFGPGVEAPVGDSHWIVRDFAANKNGTGVTRPDAVRQPPVKPDVLGTDAGALQHLARRGLFSRVLDDDLYSLRAAQGPHHSGVTPGDGGKFSRPITAIVRPGDPGSLMRLPFRGHTVAEGARRVRFGRPGGQSRTLLVIPP